MQFFWRAGIAGEIPEAIWELVSLQLNFRYQSYRNAYNSAVRQIDPEEDPLKKIHLVFALAYTVSTPQMEPARRLHNTVDSTIKPCSGDSRTRTQKIGI
jgi:hypothetical protein